MKRIVTIILLLLSIIVGGCDTEETKNSESPDVQSSTGTENTTAPEKNEESAEEEQSTNSSKPEKETQQEDTNTSTGETPKNDPKKSNEPISLPKSIAKSTPKSSTSTPEPTEDQFFKDERVIAMAGVIVVLVAIIGWQMYDRRKINEKITSPTISPTNRNLNDVSFNQSAVLSTQNPSVTTLPTWRIGTLQNIGQRSEQQDSFCLSSITDEGLLQSKGLMAVVADGMGGFENGAIISRIVTDTFSKCYNQFAISNPKNFLYDSAATAESAVEQYVSQTGVNGGSTVIAVLVKGTVLDYVSVGDSHIYLFRKGNLMLINREHNFAAFLKEKAARGEVDPNEPYVNPQRNALTAYIGMGSFKTVDQNEYPINLEPGDKVLLCSDGVYNALGDDALIRALSAGDATSCARQLQSDILLQNIPKQDNFTGIILEYAS